MVIIVPLSDRAASEHVMNLLANGYPPILANLKKTPRNLKIPGKQIRIEDF